jgi:gliding motility-associated-like protein
MGSTHLQASGGFEYTWTPAATLDNPNISNPVASPLQPTVYYVTVKKNGCTAQDSITVNVSTANAQYAYKMPSAFTPNGDNLNDCFGLKYWGGIISLEFEIYNRWGNRVFYTTDQSKCWDGTFKGVLQQTGTFVYQIKAVTICGNIYRKGTVVLIR